MILDLPDIDVRFRNPHSIFRTAHMDSELLDRSNEITKRITQLRDSL